MKKAVSRFLPSRSNSERSFSNPFKLEGINLINDFYIELDEPHRVWSPGEIVTGVAVLDLKKNITDINIMLTLMGLIKIKSGQPTGSVRRKPHILFRHTSVIYGYDHNEVSQREHCDEATIGLSKGEHRFPFSVKLPKKNIFTSISFEKGSISYSLRASINHNQSGSPSTSKNSSPASQISSSGESILMPSPKNSIHYCEKNLNIIVPINVAKIPKPQTKHAYLKVSDKKLLKTISSTSTINSNTTQSTNNSDNSTESGSNFHLQLNKDQALVKLSVDMEQSGYLRGETIPIKIRVSHYKPIQSSCGLIVTLIRLCRVDNGPETPLHSFRKDLCQVITPLYIDPQTLTAEVSTTLKVPVDSFPTIVGTGLVTFQYYIEVLANVTNKNFMKNNASQKQNASQKFSHSIMFDLGQQHDHLIMSENGMVNVDNIKRGKNMLGLNTEVIVGTERVKRNRKKSPVSQLKQQEGVGDSQGNGVDSEESMLDKLSTASISPISISHTSNVHSGQASICATSRSHSTGNDSTAPDINGGLSEKEILRRNEEALLPSEPMFHPDSSPLPSYDYQESNSEYSAPPLNGSASHRLPRSPLATSLVHHQVDMASDKAELERNRLLQLESDPPEFDYVPEYNPAGQDTIVEPETISLSSGHRVTSSELDTLKG